VTGADQHEYAGQEPKKRSNGCGSRGENQVVLRGNSRQQKKGNIFFIGEVFFLLTRPLMGDPFTSSCPQTAIGKGFKIAKVVDIK